jgi:glycerophosphoryl diester phosphodiesterase
MSRASRRLLWLTQRPIAHRGLHDRTQRRPENTLAAFNAAAEARYGIECDVHIAADGVPVVFHDDDLRRLTGIPGPVRERTSTELGDLRILGTAEWIPTLDEVLRLVAGRVPLLIELKSIPSEDEGLAFAVVERLKRYPGAAAVMSFNPELIAEVKAADRSLRRGLTALGRWRTAARNLSIARDLEVDFISYAIGDLPTPMPLLCRYLFGMPVICWTVRTPEQARKAARWTDQITFEGFLP